MKTQIYSLIFVLFGYSVSAQVGINTDDPKATLDVQASTNPNIPDGIIPPRLTGDQLLAKEAAYTAAQDGAIVYITSPRTISVGAVKTLGVTSVGTYIYNASAMNIMALPGLWSQMGALVPPISASDGFFATKAEGNLNLLSLGLNLFGTAYRSIPIRPSSVGVFDVTIPSTAVTYNSTTQDGYYVVPTTGVYHINYSYRTGQGVRAELLSGNRPGLAITKAPSATGAQTILDYRLFGGIQLLDLLGLTSVANISITQGQISHIYNLTAGEVLRFGVIQGGLAVGVLTDTSAEISIYKIK